MSKRIDYRKLYRKVSRQNKSLTNKIEKTNEIIELQGKMIKELSKKVNHTLDIS